MMDWEAQPLGTECTRKQAGFWAASGDRRLRRPGFIRFAALLAIVFVGAVVGAFFYILKDPGAPLSLPKELRPADVSPAQPSAPGTQKPANSPDSAKVTALLDSINNLLHSSQISEAEAVLKGAIAEHPNDQRLYITYAELLLGKENDADAYENYVKALATGDRSAKLEFQAGTVASMLGKQERALEHYVAAQTADPTNPDYPLYLGQIQMQLNKLDEARATFVRASQLSPENAAVWGSLAEIALRENKLDVAMQQIEKARALQPRETIWRFMEARIHSRAGRPEKAVELLLPLNPADRNSEFIARVLADALSMLKRDKDAADVLEAASDAVPKNANLAFDAAMRAKKAGQNEQIEKLRRRARALGHPNAKDLD